MDTKIQKAMPEDAKVLSNIAYSAKAHWGYPQRWMELWRPQFDFPPAYFEENESWVVEIDGNPIGFYTLLEKKDKAWIENMWVLPDYIGMGMGKMLFLHGLSRSRQIGYRVLQLEADPNAIGFYEKMGMYKVGESSYPVEGEMRILPLMEIVL